MRDSQRARLYKAEQAVRNDEARGTDSVAGIDQRIEQGDLQAAQVYVERALQLVRDHQDAFQLAERWTRPVEVFTHRARSKATYYGAHARIGLTPTSWSWRGLVLTHEVAHHLTPHLLPSHGAHFAHNFVTLLRLTESVDAARALEDSFVRGRVTFTRHEATTHAFKYARKVLAESISATGDFPWVVILTHDGRSHVGYLGHVGHAHLALVNRDHDVNVPAGEVAYVAQRDRFYRP